MHKVLSDIWTERLLDQAKIHRKLQSHVKYSLAKSLEEQQRRHAMITLEGGKRRSKYS